MNNIIAELPKTLAISSAECTCKRDRLHFDPVGNRSCGKRNAEKVVSLLGR